MNAVGWNNSVRGARSVSGAWNTRGAKGDKKPKICFGRGREGHFAGDKSCSARDHGLQEEWKSKPFSNQMYA